MIPLFKAIVGSQAYGTNTPTSDIDIKGIYIQNPLDILSFYYKPQINVDKDTCYYEIRRFLELLLTSNPTMLELLFTPENCILYKTDIWELIQKQRSLFITKECQNSFLGYARQQIYKAQGLNKKMNWEQDKITRKSPIDFLTVLEGIQTKPLKTYLKEHNLKENFCGLAKIDHTQQLYALYYDDIADIINTSDSTNPRYKDFKPHGYKGICNDSQLLLSEIPKYQIANHLCYVSYNLNGFQQHCKDYNSYQTWLKERNLNRYVDVKNHQQKIDGKNIMHCYRLLTMAKEIALYGTINVRRSDAEDLLKIRRGEVSLNDLIIKANDLFVEITELFKQSSLPEHIDKNTVHILLKDIRFQSFKLFNLSCYL